MQEYNPEVGALRGRYIGELPTVEGRLLAVVLIEPNGDEHPIECLMRQSQTDLAGDPETIEYLKARYGEEEVYKAALAAALGL